MSDKDENERDEFFDAEDELLGGQPLDPDPYTPEPGPRPGDRRAFTVLRLAWIVIGIVVAAIVIYAVAN